MAPKRKPKPTTADNYARLVELLGLIGDHRPYYDEALRLVRKLKAVHMAPPSLSALDQQIASEMADDEHVILFVMESIAEQDADGMLNTFEIATHALRRLKEKG